MKERWQRRIDQINKAIEKHRKTIENLNQEKEMLQKKLEGEGS